MLDKLDKYNDKEPVYIMEVKQRDLILDTELVQGDEILARTTQATKRGIQNYYKISDAPKTQEDVDKIMSVFQAHANEIQNRNTRIIKAKDDIKQDQNPLTSISAKKENGGMGAVDEVDEDYKWDERP